jgi:hypothetical protein
MKPCVSVWLCATALVLVSPENAEACKRRARFGRAVACAPAPVPVCASPGVVGPHLITVQVMVARPVAYSTWPPPQSAYGFTDEGLAMTGKVWSPTNPSYGPYTATGPPPSPSGFWYINFGALPSQSGVTLSLYNANGAKGSVVGLTLP